MSDARPAASLTTLDAAFVADPYDGYDALRARGRVLWSAAENAWLVSGYAEAAAAFSDPGLLAFDTAGGVVRAARIAGRDLSALEALMGAMVLLKNPPEHEDARRFLMAAMAAPSLSALEEAVSSIVDRRLSAWPAGVELDAIPAIAEPIPALVIGHLLGLGEETAEKLAAAAPQMAVVLDRMQSLRTYERLSRLAAAARDTLLGEIERRRRAPGTDGLSRLLELADTAHLTDEDVAYRTFFLMVAGVETTTALLASVIKAVLERPDVTRALVAEPSLTEAAVEEAIRLESPVHIVFRRAASDIVLAGQAIKAGDTVLILIGAAHRDPQVYDRPSAFDLRRAGPPNLGFGWGIHHCIGARLARFEAKRVLAGALRRQARLATTNYSWRPTRFIRQLKTLPMTFADDHR